MPRNILFSAGIILIVLSLFLPWFTVTYNTQYMVRDNLYEDGSKIETEIVYSENYYLDRQKLELTATVERPEYTDNTYDGNYTYHREGMETKGFIDFLSGFLYSFYKIMLVAIALSFLIVALEAFGNEANLASMKTGITLFLVVIMLSFAVGVKDAYVRDQGDQVMGNSPNSDEYVNMTFPVGFNTLIRNETFTQYYELINFTYEEVTISVSNYNDTDRNHYIRFFAAPDPDMIEWDNQWIPSNESTTYYIWFDKYKDDENSQYENATNSIKVDITDLSSETENSATIIKTRIIQAIMANTALVFDVESTGPEQLRITALNYGQVQDPDGWYGGYSVNQQGDTEFEAVAGDQTQKINWYPSTGFVVTLIGLFCFVGSRFEDS